MPFGSATHSRQGRSWSAIISPKKENVMETVERVLHTTRAHTKGAFPSTDGRLDVKLSSAGGAGNSTLIQRVAICFAAGVIGGLAVVLLGYFLFETGVSAALGVDFPVRLNAPEIYRPLFWAGLWGIPFGLLIKAAWG